MNGALSLEEVEALLQEVLEMAWDYDLEAGNDFADAPDIEEPVLIEAEPGEDFGWRQWDFL